MKSKNGSKCCFKRPPLAKIIIIIGKDAFIQYPTDNLRLHMCGPLIRMMSCIWQQSFARAVKQKWGSTW